MYARIARQPVVLASIFAGYFLLGRLGLSLGAPEAAVTAIWLPSGLALVAFLLFGSGVWPALLLGSMFVRLIASGDIISSIGICVGNTLEGYLAAKLVDRFAGGPEVFQSSDTIFRFTTIIAIASSVSAIVGVIVLSLLGVDHWADFPTRWLTWWMSHVTGNLVVAPFLLLWVTTPMERPKILETLEAIGLLVMLVAVGLLVFGGLFPSDIKNYPLEFLCVPFFLWAAFRFGRRETATALLILTGIAMWGTVRHFGPFARDTQDESLVLLQAYTCVMGIMAVVLAATVADHKIAESQLHELATTDPLTGLANYRRLIEVLRGEIARSNRTRRPFAVLFVDMNGLKKINDKFGHLVGSRALCRIADTLRRSCRTIDTPARFGGDEFAIVLPETTDEGGMVVLRRVHEALATDGDSPTLSVSGGVAVFPQDGETPTMLLRAADKALYQGKVRPPQAPSTKHVAVDEPKAANLF
jgi:diguanylate cyclase (GGDEF)-like protein